MALTFNYNIMRGTVEVRRNANKVGEIVAGIDSREEPYFQYWHGSTRKGATARMSSISAVKESLNYRDAKGIPLWQK